MKKHLLIVAGLILCLPVQGQERTTVMNDVTIWYDAFNNRDAALAQKVMSEDWNDIPAAPGQPPGRKGVEFILDDLSKAFPDFRITPVEILSGWKQSCRPLRAKDYPHLAQRGLADCAPPTGRVREVATLDRCSGAKTRAGEAEHLVLARPFGGQVAETSHPHASG